MPLPESPFVVAPLDSLACEIATVGFTWSQVQVNVLDSVFTLSVSSLNAPALITTVLVCALAVASSDVSVAVYTLLPVSVNADMVPFVAVISFTLKSCPLTSVTVNVIVILESFVVALSATLAVMATSGAVLSTTVKSISSII